MRRITRNFLGVRADTIAQAAQLVELGLAQFEVPTYSVVWHLHDHSRLQADVKRAHRRAERHGANRLALAIEGEERLTSAEERAGRRGISHELW